jgi:hypothetical protein
MNLLSIISPLKTSIMKTAKTQAEFDKIKKTISGKEKKLGINKFYEALPFDPKLGFAKAQDIYEKNLKVTSTIKFSNLKFEKWGKKPIYVEKGYKHQVENFVKGFLTYYETWDGGTGEEHTVFFEWKKFKSGFNLTLHLKPWYNNPYPGKPNTMITPGSAVIPGCQVVLLKSPIPAPPKAGVDPPPPPPCPPPSKS